MDLFTCEIAPKKSVETTWIIEHWNYIEKNTWKQQGFFDHRSYIKKSTWKQRGFFDQRNYIEKVCGNNVVFDVST